MSQALGTPEKILGYIIPIIIIILSFAYSGGEIINFIVSLVLGFSIYFLIVLAVKFGIPEPRIVIVPLLITLSTLVVEKDERIWMFLAGIFSFSILQLIFAIVHDEYKNNQQTSPVARPEWAIKSK